MTGAARIFHENHVKTHQDLTSWGRVSRRPQKYIKPQFCDQLPDYFSDETDNKVLACGLRRSYGDSCLNHGGVLIDVSSVNRFISFDPQSGVLNAEAGVSLSQILKAFVPRGWFLPTTPGTRFVTLGGAIANDVHGKNHHSAGSFGCSVEEINLIKGDGRIVQLSPQKNDELFAATIGGLGLTGIIQSAALRLTKIPSSFLDVETICYNNLEEFWELSGSSESSHEHTVSWIDCSGKDNKFGRGVFSRANWCDDGDYVAHSDKSWKNIPLDMPGILLNHFSVAAFNEIYFKFNKRNSGRGRVHYANFFYPLDAIQNWNRLYGKSGFYQYQCVLPPNSARDAVAALLKEISPSGQGSFLAVLKTFGKKKSPGLLSFPRPGATLALDFPNRGQETLKLMSKLDVIISGAGGALYPAKDGRMSADLFRQSFPSWQEFIPYVDARFNSDFWDRVSS